MTILFNRIGAAVVATALVAALVPTVNAGQNDGCLVAVGDTCVRDPVGVNPCLGTPVGAVCVDEPDPCELLPGTRCPVADPCGDHIDPQTDGGDKPGSSLCVEPFFGAACTAVGLYVDVAPGVAPGLSNTVLSRSHAEASHVPLGNAQADSDAHQVNLGVGPSWASVGAIDSSCKARSSSDLFVVLVVNEACGTADLTDVSLDLTSIVPVTLSGTVLFENGCTKANNFGALSGFNSANVVSLSGTVAGNGFVVAPGPVPANTQVPIGPLATLYLNEQFTQTYGFFAQCQTNYGDALRLVVNEPTGGTVTVIVGWVATAACIPF